MKRSHGKTILKYTLMTVIPLILGAASFLFFLSYTGQIDLKDYFRGVTLDPWPAYDPDYRLDMQEEPLTEEQVARYIATKIPDDCKSGVRKIRLVAQYECVQLGPGPDYSEELNVNGYPVDPPYYARPYKNSVVLAEGFIGLEIRIMYDPDRTDGNLSPGYIINSIGCAFGSTSDYALIRIDVANHGQGFSYDLVKKSDYERFYPNYAVQPAG